MHTNKFSIVIWQKFTSLIELCFCYLLALPQMFSSVMSFLSIENFAHFLKMSNRKFVLLCSSISNHRLFAITNYPEIPEVEAGALSSFVFRTKMQLLFLNNDNNNQKLKRVKHLRALHWTNKISKALETFVTVLVFQGNGCKVNRWQSRTMEFGIFSSVQIYIHLWYQKKKTQDSSIFIKWVLKLHSSTWLLCGAQMEHHHAAALAFIRRNQRFHWCHCCQQD